MFRGVNPRSRAQFTARPGRADSGTMRVALVLVVAAAAARPAPAAGADADPPITLTRLSAPNPEGWHNSPVVLMHVCAAGVACPPQTVLEADGVHRLPYPLRDMGAPEQAWDDPTIVRLDRTPPVVRLRLPERIETRAATIRVAADVSDALSGIAAATCNGRPAQVANGLVTCTVDLRSGVNDVVVQASDVAENTASAGARVVRTGPARALRVVPGAATLLIGQTLRLQVLDDLDRVVPRVEWFVDRPDVGELLPDGSPALRALAPGVLTLTASIDGLRADASIAVVEGATLPDGAIAWQVGGLRKTRVSIVPPRGGPPRPWIATTDGREGRGGTVRVHEESTGLVTWTEIAAFGDDEVAREIYWHGEGGILVVVDERNGTRSAIVRTGPASVLPWRYQSSGRLRPELVVDSHGVVGAIETPASGYPQLVILDGRDGHVIKRATMPVGTRIERNVDCVAGRTRGIRVPAGVGPPTLHKDSTVSFELLAGEDEEDACAGGTLLRQRRWLHLFRLGHGPEWSTDHLLRTYDAPDESAPPAVDLFPTVLDRQGALLAPWRLTPGDGGPIESRVSHVAADGFVGQYELPAVGKLYPGDDDLVATGDATTMLLFHGDTGAVRWVKSYPGGEVRILEMRGSKVLAIVQGRDLEF